MSPRDRPECRQCRKLALEIAGALADVLRAESKDALRVARRRCSQVLADKQRHELVTGHIVSS